MKVKLSPGVPNLCIRYERRSRSVVISKISGFSYTFHRRDFIAKGADGLVDGHINPSNVIVMQRDPDLLRDLFHLAKFRREPKIFLSAARTGQHCDQIPPFSFKITVQRRRVRHQEEGVEPFKGWFSPWKSAIARNITKARGFHFD